jgi:flagella basal body P-ring formation protein FlgA
MKYILALMISFFSMAAIASSVPSYIFNVSYEDAQEAVGNALSEKLSTDKGENIKVAAAINGKKPAPLYSSNKPINVEIRGLRREDELNRWSASMVISDEETVISAMPLAGRYSVLSEVPVLKRALRNGDVISEADIELKFFAQERVSSDTVLVAADLVGRTPIRSASPNRPLRNSEISAPALVKKNALVQMRYKTQTMEITTTGQALQDGAKGDVIEVRNEASKKVARAVVAENNIVDVLAQGAQTSQIMPEKKIGADIYAQ